MKPPESLVQYSDPYCVDDEEDEESHERVKIEQLREIMGPKVQLPNLESKPSTEEILNAILPPREWVDKG